MIDYSNINNFYEKLCKEILPEIELLLKKYPERIDLQKKYLAIKTICTTNDKLDGILLADALYKSKELEKDLKNINDVKIEYVEVPGETIYINDCDKLKAELARLKTELDEFKASDSKLQKEKDKLQTDLDRLINELSELKDDVSDKDNEITALRQQIAALRQQIAELTDKNKKLEGENGELQVRLAKLDLELNSYGDYIQTITSINSDIEAERDKLKSELNRLKSELNRLKSELTGLKADGSDKDDIIKKLEKDIADLGQQITDLTTKNKKLEGENKKLEGQLTNLQNELAGVSSFNRDIQREKDKLQTELDRLQAELTKLKDDGSTKDNEITALRQQINNLGIEIINLTEKNTKLENQNNGLKAELARLKTELDGVNSFNSDIQREKKVLEAELTKLKDELTKLKDDGSTKDTEITALRQQIDDLGQQIAELTDKNKTLTNENRILVDDNEDLQFKNNELNNSLEQLLALSTEMEENNKELKLQLEQLKNQLSDKISKGTISCDDIKTLLDNFFAEYSIIVNWDKLDSLGVEKVEVKTEFIKEKGHKLSSNVLTADRRSYKNIELNEIDGKKITKSFEVLLNFYRKFCDAKYNPVIYKNTSCDIRYGNLKNHINKIFYKNLDKTNYNDHDNELDKQTASWNRYKKKLKSTFDNIRPMNLPNNDNVKHLEDMKTITDNERTRQSPIYGNNELKHLYIGVMEFVREQSMVHTLVNEYLHCIKYKDKYTEQQAKLDDLRSDVDITIAKLEEEIFKLKKNQKLNEEIIHNLENSPFNLQFNGPEDNADKINNLVASLEAKVAILKDEVVRLTNDVVRLEDKVEILEGENTSFENTFKEELEKWESEKKILEQKLIESNKLNSEQNAQNAQLSNQITIVTYYDVYIKRLGKICKHESYKINIEPKSQTYDKVLLSALRDQIKKCMKHINPNNNFISVSKNKDIIELETKIKDYSKCIETYKPNETNIQTVIDKIEDIITKMEQYARNNPTSKTGGGGIIGGLFLSASMCNYVMVICVILIMILMYVLYKIIMYTPYLKPQFQYQTPNQIYYNNL